MGEVDYTQLPDTQRQHIASTVKTIREYMTPTLDSFTKSNRKISGGQQGYQIPFFVTDYGQNSYLTPGAAGNSFMQPVSPTSQSMWVGLSYQAAAMRTDGIFLATMDEKESLINEAQLRELRIENFMKHQNYWSIGDGSGVVAVVTSVAAGVFTGSTASAINSTKGAHRLIKGVTYDIVDETSFAVVGTITPTANGTNSTTVTCTSTGLPNNAGAFVCEQGGYNRVPRGLGYLIATGPRVFQGLDTTGFVEFNSSGYNLSGAAISSATINLLKTKVQVRMNAPTKEEFARIGHTTPGQFTTLANQGFSARSYWAQDGKADTTFGYPEKYVDGNMMILLDADIDEDRFYMRRASDYFRFELKEFGPVDRDGLKTRMSPGDNNVGADDWFSSVSWYYNLAFDGNGSGGNYASAYIYGANVPSGTSQATV